MLSAGSLSCGLLSLIPGLRYKAAGRSMRKVPGFLRPGPGTHGIHLHHIVTAKATHKACPDSGGGETLSTLERTNCKEFEAIFDPRLRLAQHRLPGGERSHLLCFAVAMLALFHFCFYILVLLRRGQRLRNAIFLKFSIFYFYL